VKYDWDMKFMPGQFVMLNKYCRMVEVEIEGVACNKATGWEVLYSVREVEARIAYPASQSHLSKKPAKSP